MWVPTSRSRIRKVEAIITAGMAKMITNEVTNIDQTKSGIRSSDMPGARCFSTVTMVATATAKDDTSV